MPSPLTLKEDFLTIKFNSFASRGKAVLYAGVDKISNLFNNWVAAIEYAKKHSMFPIQYTEGGLILDATDNERGKTYSGDDYKRVWDRASVKYCLNIEGLVKTFVCGATNRSTFRRKEIHAMIRAKYINDINGQPHEDYVLLRRATLNRLREENKLLPDDKKLSGKERHHMAINAATNDNTDKDETDEAIEEMLMANPHLQAVLSPLLAHRHPH